MSIRSSGDGPTRGPQLAKEVHDHIRNLVDQAPPLTSVQRGRLTVLLARPSSDQIPQGGQGLGQQKPTWVDGLPEEDLRAFLLELVKACHDGHSPEQIDQLIMEWRRTAEGHEEVTP